MNRASKVEFEEGSELLLRSRRKYDAIVIGASTGGPKAISYIIKNLPTKINIPIFIVQHMPETFSGLFAARLNKDSPVEIVEVKDGIDVIGNKVYIAPGGYHMVIESEKIMLLDGPKLHGVKPAADKLFNSAAPKYKDRLMGIILTGMGKDGADGMMSIKEYGGYNVVQDEDTSIVFGMPGNAISRGVVDKVLSLEDISKIINDVAR